MEGRPHLLNSAKIIETIQRLTLRIEDRFPESGLLTVSKALHHIATETDLTIDWISRPNYFVRAISVAVIAFLGMLLILAFFAVEFDQPFTFVDLVTLAEAGTNEIVLLGAAIAFLVTIERRQKRHRVISAVAQLRSIAHVIDAHQLTKDPGAGSKPTTHSPKRDLTENEMKRYLNYCSEMLSLTSKVAFLYAQNFPDQHTEQVIHDLETLTLGLSNKVWQKIMLLD